MIKKAIIPAAGFGTRSLPITKAIPKEMFPINNRPSIQYVVEEAVSAGIEQLLIIVSRSKNLIVDYFDHSLELEMFLQKANKSSLMEKVKIPDIQIFYTRQPFAKGLGDAVRLGKDFVGDDPFAVLLPDDLIIGKGIKDLIDVYDETHSHVIGLTEVETERLQNYGVIQGTLVRDGLYDLTNIIEKPKQNAPSNLAVIGRYLFTPEIMAALDKVAPDRSGEIQLTDGIKRVMDKDKCYGKIISGQRFDIGSEADYIAMQMMIFNQKNKS
ncbi:UTP--glucose-1-phosphate uridylyltransferase [Sporolactobacillus kofuensis]|uniref:UTP--glucose-1-phosphate uridylyltransferase n=1 Tax=Sporolactobacillus kofuensis TaxID=269672 RepID=A0ABW1WBT8_9BACL|nr:UTP--glucose-1-phosphate uridylyltransferase [Sporolactobacillus kofuensis]MCO7175213.1 UTP--glucose-1-phosphate uridylyltransferase [Sporolactobacillus kofuensis]